MDNTLNVEVAADAGAKANSKEIRFEVVGGRATSWCSSIFDYLVLPLHSYSVFIAFYQC